MVKYVECFYKEFIYGGHLQSLGASVVVILVAALLSAPISWHLPLLIYLVFYLLYLYNRFKEIHLDAETNPERTQHFLHYIHKMPLLMILLFVLIAVLLRLYATNIWAAIFSVALVVLGLLYTAYFKNVTKKFFAFKNYYVALFFASLVFLWAVYYNQSVSAVFFAVFILVYAKAFCMQVLLDVKDVKSDAQQGLKTFAVRYGREIVVKYTTIVSIIISCAGFIILYLFLPNSLKYTSVFLLEIPLVVVAGNLILANKKSGYILASAEFFYIGLFLFILFLF